MNRRDRMLSCLLDGKVWTRADLFRARGYYLTNNAAHEIRRDYGYEVEELRVGEEYAYLLPGIERIRDELQVAA